MGAKKQMVKHSYDKLGEDSPNLKTHPRVVEVLLTTKGLDQYRLKTNGDRGFSVVAPRLWNQLPLKLRTVTSADQFKTQLKTYLFKLVCDV